MNEIVKFTSDTGTPVQITPQDVKNTLCPGATDKEVAMFLELCRAQRLNPWIKDAYLVKYGNGPASIITGKETFTKRANANPAFKGMEHGVVFMRKTPQGVTVEKREGAAIYKKAGEELLGGWARVHVDGKMPVYAELALEEYTTGKSNWAKMPAVMINKCAQVAALRLAFPDAFQGLYAAEEMGRAGEATRGSESKPAPVDLEYNDATGEVVTVVGVEAEAEIMATDEQLQDLAALVETFALMRGKTAEDVKLALYGTKAARAVGVVPGQDMTADQCEALCNVLAAWIEKANAEAAQEAACEPEPAQEYEQEDIQF